MEINEDNQLSNKLGTDLKASCPDWLTSEAKEEWERLAPKLVALGRLTNLDLTAFSEGKCISPSHPFCLQSPPNSSPTQCRYFCDCLSCACQSPIGIRQWEKQPIYSTEK